MRPASGRKTLCSTGSRDEDTLAHRPVALSHLRHRVHGVTRRTVRRVPTPDVPTLLARPHASSAGPTRRPPLPRVRKRETTGEAELKPHQRTRTNAESKCDCGAFIPNTWTPPASSRCGVRPSSRRQCCSVGRMATSTTRNSSAFGHPNIRLVPSTCICGRSTPKRAAAATNSIDARCSAPSVRRESS